MRSLMPKWFAAMAAVSAAVVAYGTWQSLTAGSIVEPETVQPEAVQELKAPAKDITLKNYFWIDAVPDNAYTPFNSYVFTDGIGINSQFASSFKVLLEIFEYRSTKDKVNFEFPHDNRSAKSSYTITDYKNPKYPFLTAQLTLTGDPQAKGKEKAYFTGPDLHLDSQGYNLPAPLQNALISARARINAQNH